MTRTQLKPFETIVSRDFTITMRESFVVLAPEDTDPAELVELMAGSKHVRDMEWDSSGYAGEARVNGPVSVMGRPARGDRHYPELWVDGGELKEWGPKDNALGAESVTWWDINGRRWLLDSAGAAAVREDCAPPAHGGATWPATHPAGQLELDVVVGNIGQTVREATSTGHPGVFDARFAPVLQAGEVWSAGALLRGAVVKRDGEAIAVVMPVDTTIGSARNIDVVDFKGRPTMARKPADTIDLSSVAKP